MIRVTVEVVPFGEDELARVVGQYIIGNEGRDEFMHQLNGDEDDHYEYVAVLQDEIGIRSTKLTYVRSRGWERLLQRVAAMLVDTRYDR